jgi:phosphoribosylanthranilate isomerase
VSGVRVSAAVRIKICGITTIEDAEVCLGVGVDTIGLNLVPASPRFIDVGTASTIARAVGSAAEIVLVVADQSVESLRELMRQTGAACLQLHGEESPDTVAALLPRAYKAIRVAGEGDVAVADSFPGERILVDAKVAGRLGGTGQTVDFDLVASLARRRRLLLAGGLTPDNVARAIERVRPFGVDVASGVEAPGTPRRKDPARVAGFVRAVRQCVAC